MFIGKSEEEQILIKTAMKEKKRRGLGKVNVYFNKKAGNKETTYCSGKHISDKSEKEITYRSSYELRHFLNLDKDPKVKTYYSEVIDIPYVDSQGKNRKYIPDLIVVYIDGTIEVHEIKPKEMLKDINVQRKAKACRKFLGESLDQSVKYKFVTEEDLFASSKEYSDFVKYCKKLEKK
jgi:hypothetical protein